MAATDNPKDAAALRARDPHELVQDAINNPTDPRAHRPKLVGLLAHKRDEDTGRLWLPVAGEFPGTLYVEFDFEHVDSFIDVPKGDPPFPGHDVVVVTFSSEAVLEIHRKLRVPVADLDTHARQRGLDGITSIHTPGDWVGVRTYNWVVCK
jgi:hypothetical protein